MNVDVTLDSILDGLYKGTEDNGGQNPPEEKKDEQGAPEESQKAPESKPEEEMTDEELALSVSVDLPDAPKGGSPAPKEGDKTPEEPPKKRTAEDAKKIREEAEADVRTLRSAFPELANLRGLGELQDSRKYLEYRKKGLTAEEAYTLSYAGVKRREAQAGGVKKPDLRSSPSSGGLPDANAPTTRETREFCAQTGMSLADAKKYFRKF